MKYVSSKVKISFKAIKLIQYLSLWCEGDICIIMYVFSGDSWRLDARHGPIRTSVAWVVPTASSWCIQSWTALVVQAWFPTLLQLMVISMLSIYYMVNCRDTTHRFSILSDFPVHNWKFYPGSNFGIHNKVFNSLILCMYCLKHIP